MRNKSDRVGLGEMMAYSMGGFGRNLVHSTCLGLLNYFYTNSIGMAAGLVGTVFMLSRFLDGVTDIATGVMVDKVNSKHGKARNWILWIAIPYALSGLLMFAVPPTTVFWQGVYMAITYNLCTSIMGTLFYIPLMTLPALMTQDQGQRHKITIVNQLFVTVAGVIPAGFLYPTILRMGNTQAAWLKVIGVMCAVAAAAMLICFLFTKERVTGQEYRKTEDKVPLKVMLKALFSNKYWVMLLGVFIFEATSSGVMYSSTPYYCQYILNNANLYSAATVILQITVFVALLLGGLLVKRLSKRNIFILGTALRGCGHIIVGMTGSLIGLYVGLAIVGCGIGFSYSTMYAFVPDVMEYGEWKTGIRLEGTLQSACSIGAKVGLGLGPGIVGMLMQSAGFNGMIAQQPEAVLHILPVCAVWLPACFCLVLIIIVFLFDLDKRYDGIMKDLQERHAVSVHKK